MVKSFSWLLTCCAVAVAASSQSSLESFDSLSTVPIEGPSNNPDGPLQDGVPFYKTTPSGTNADYFVFFPSPAWSLVKVIVSPILGGNPNLFVFPGVVSGNYPDPTISPGSYPYQSAAVYGFDAIIVNVSDTAVKSSSNCNAQACQIAIAVVCAYGRTCSYSVTATDGRNASYITSLTPVLGVLAPGTVDVYTLPVPSWFNSYNPQLTLSLSPYLTGPSTFSPSLLVASDQTVVPPGVNCGSNSPNLTSPSSYFEQDSPVSVSGFAFGEFSKAYDCFPGTQTTPGKFFIGVAANPDPSLTSNTYYTLTANLCSQLSPAPQGWTFCQSPVQTLTDGLPYAGSGTSYLQYDYYVYNATFYAATTSTPAVRIVRISTANFVGSTTLVATVGPVATVGQPTLSNYDYISSRYSGQNEIAIRYNDTGSMQTWCGAALSSNIPCQINIGVVTVTSRSSYAVTAASGSFYKLRNNYPYTDFVGTQDSTSYSFSISRTNASATFYITAQSGSMYFLVGSDTANMTYPRPGNVASYFVQSAISPVGGNTVQVTVNPGSFGFCTTPPCNYYITVCGNNFVGGSYVIEARQGGTSGNQLLVLNVPTADTLGPSTTASAPPNGGANYNTYFLGFPQANTGTLAPTQSVTIVLDSQPTAKPMLIATVSSVGSNWSALSPYAGYPNNPNYYYAPAIDSGSTTTQMIISSTDSQFLSSSTCAKSIALRPYNISCYVIIWVIPDPTQQSNILITPFVYARQLTDGVSVQSQVGAFQFTYFRYTVGSVGIPLRSITASVAAISGDPDLYIGVGNPPNVTNFQYFSRSSGTEVVQIRFDDPIFLAALAANKIRGPPFDVYIGVFGYDGPSAFEVVASEVGLLTLNPGIPTATFVNATALRYFQFYVPPQNTSSGGVSDAVGVRLSWTVTRGSSILFLVNDVPSANANISNFPLLPRCVGQIPGGGCPTSGATTFYNVVYQSDTSGFLEMEPFLPNGSPDPLYRSGGYWAIAAYPFDGISSQFEVTASYLSTIVSLQNGVAYTGSVKSVPSTGQKATDGYAFFAFTIATQFNNVTFKLETLSANANQNPSLFASFTNKRPTSYNYNKTANATDRTVPDYLSFSLQEVIAGNPNCATLTSCTIYVSVFGFSRTINQPQISFRLTALTTYNATYTLLQNGIPTQDAITANTYAYYKAQLSLPDLFTSVSFTLSPTAGSVDMYATIDGTTPSRTNCQFFSNTTGLGVDYFVISPTAKGYARNMTVLVAVYANPPSSPSAYYIWYNAGSNIFTQISAGIEYSSYLDSAGAEYFYYVSNSPAAVSITVTPIDNGLSNPDLYVLNYQGIVNNTNFRPGPNNAPNTANCANSTQDGLDFIYIPSALGESSNRLGVTASNCRSPTLIQTFLIGVVCGARCRFQISAVTGFFTPTALRDGVPTSLAAPTPLQPVYASFDLSGTLLVGRNITITAQVTSGGGTVRMYAANSWTSGLSDPAELPGQNTGYSEWIVPSESAPATSSFVYTIKTDDPSIKTCNQSAVLLGGNCNTLTMGFIQVNPNTPNCIITVTVYSTGGPPITLLFSQTTGTITVAQGVTRNFRFNLPVVNRDFVILVQRLENQAAIAGGMDRDISKLTCTSTDPISGCPSTWILSQDPGFLQLFVSASNPCRNANPASNCNPASFTPGAYFLGITALPSALPFAAFSVSISFNTTATPLIDGVPITSGVNDIVQGFYRFDTAPTTNLATQTPVRFFATSYAYDTILCVSAGCVEGQSCTPANRDPKPGSSTIVTCKIVPAYSGDSIVIDASSNFRCTQAILGLPCTYYSRVLAGPNAGPCTSASNCQAEFDILAQEVNSLNPLQVNYQQMFKNVYKFTNITLLGGKPQPFSFNLGIGPTSDFLVTLESCGNGGAAIYLTNPDTCFLPACNPFKPSSTNFANAARTYGAPGRPWAGGRDFTRMTVSGGVAFGTVYQDNTPTQYNENLHGRSLQTAPLQPQINLYLSYNRAYYIAPGIPGQTAGLISLTKLPATKQYLISWSPAWIVDQAQQPITAAVGVTYAVFLVVGSFNQTPGAIGGSFCGLSNWFNAQGNGQNTPTSFRYNTNLPNLTIADPNAFFELNVAVICGADCFKANNLAPTVSETINIRSSPSGRARVLQTGIPTEVQTAPYLVRDVNYAPTVVPTPNPSSNQAGIPIAILGGAIGGGVALLLCCCGAAYFVRSRRAAGKSLGLPSVPQWGSGGATAAAAAATTAVATTADNRAARVAQLGASSSSIQIPTTSPDLAAARAERAAFQPEQARVNATV